MAWTTSACARARPTFAELAAARLKPAKYRFAALRRSLLRTQPGIFLALSAVSLGVLVPLLPTNFTAAILLMTGTALAVFGAGANLAGAVSTSRNKRAPADRANAPAAFATSEIALDPAPQPMHLPKTVRTRRHPPVHAANYDWADLMSRINHELRTPLNAVIGFSEVMALEMFGPLGSERYQEYARYIRDSAGDLLKSAEDTLALTALLTKGVSATHVDRRASAKIREGEVDASITAECCSEQREKGLVLVNWKELPITKSPAFGGKHKTHDSYFRQKGFCHIDSS